MKQETIQGTKKTTLTDKEIIDHIKASFADIDFDKLRSELKGKKGYNKAAQSFIRGLEDAKAGRISRWR